MNFKMSKCVVKNFVYLSLMVICASVVMLIAALIIDYFIGEIGMLIIVTIMLIFAIIYTAFDECR